MKFGLYPRLAMAGIRKNKRLYVPYLLTCTGMVMMYYIIVFLQHNAMLENMRGDETVSTILGLGSWVVAIFACIFLFYTHSFLLRRRKKEFGLYNILGMGRRHLVRIEIWETLFVALGTTAAGLLCGIAFSKLAELGLLNLMGNQLRFFHQHRSHSGLFAHIQRHSPAAPAAGSHCGGAHFGHPAAAKRSRR